ncbi:hypothetical protein [Corynebacterium sp. TAE3-ERU12]|uniref:hypothetical protein n=1 Tax=Corynebacterium sp. TAE3-ERU12 TaxID=2849491 RepID=UPI00351D50AC
MSSTPQIDHAPASQPPRRRVRVVQLIFLIAAVTATMLLAYWQFSRWETTSSFQNLGYALQWPAFGAFFIWAYRRYMEYEKERAAGNIEAAVNTDDDTMTEIPEGFLPPRPGSESATTQQSYEDTTDQER